MISGVRIRRTPPERRRTAGGTLILVVLTLLILTVFAVLSLTGALYAHKLAKKSAELAIEGFLAQTKVEDILCEIKSSACEEENFSSQDRREEYARTLGDLGYDTLFSDDEISVTYDVRVNDTSAVRTVVKIRYLQKEPHVTVESRRTVYTKEWVPDLMLDLPG